ncbi:DNA-directed RNA polymerase subunit alpha C-terminal domain-containing protein [Paraburkholderia silvatlantica]|uniref:DNA-directed RNA polymerase subunit alpha C-terminal domain-containing protein n=1 Tax=Paraburkholderia silvatlantica TaxID=321895 RepID=UPI003750E484
MSAVLEAGIDRNTRIEALGLHSRITNRLRAGGVYRVADLCACSAEDLLRLPGIGKRSIAGVQQAITRAGFSLRAGERA